jgi:hypothetical protein
MAVEGAQPLAGDALAGRHGHRHRSALDADALG